MDKEIIIRTLGSTDPPFLRSSLHLLHSLICPFHIDSASSWRSSFNSIPTPNSLIFSSSNPPACPPSKPTAHRTSASPPQRVRTQMPKRPRMLRPESHPRSHPLSTTNSSGRTPRNRIVRDDRRLSRLTQKYVPDVYLRTSVQ